MVHGMILLGKGSTRGFCSMGRRAVTFYYRGVCCLVLADKEGDSIQGYNPELPSRLLSTRAEQRKRGNVWIINQETGFVIANNKMRISCT